MHFVSNERGNHLITFAGNLFLVNLLGKCLGCCQAWPFSSMDTICIYIYIVYLVYFLRKNKDLIGCLAELHPGIKAFTGVSEKQKGQSRPRPTLGHPAKLCVMSLSN